MVSRLTQSRGLFRCWRKFVVYPFLVEEFCDSADLRQQPMLPVASHRAMPENRWRWSDRPESGARCGCSSMVEQEPSKLMTAVRFRPPAPSRCSSAVEQRTCNPLVAGSTPAAGSKTKGNWRVTGSHTRLKRICAAVRRGARTGGFNPLSPVASRVGELSKTHPKGEDGLA